MSPALWVLLISGLLGFRVGMVGFPDWQVAVETTQVIAGFVEYPASNPFFIYHTKLWTVLHQLLAIFLLAGVSEIQLSLVLSGVLGMVTFQALAMFVYAFSRNVLLAIGAAVLIFFTRAAEHGAVYGLFLLGTENTYGILGLSFCVLAVALIGSGWYRTGALFLGLAPAVHPTLGAWIGLVAACVVLWDFRNLRKELRPALGWFLVGCAVTAVSLAIQLAFIYQTPPPTDATFTKTEIAAFITFWDGHRKPVDVTNNGVSLNFAALALASIWLIGFSRALPRSSIFLLRVMVVSAVMSIALVFVSWIPPDRLPTWLLVMMPGRVLNFNALTFVALVIGLLTNYWTRLWAQVLMLFLLVGLVLGDHSMFWEWLLQNADIRYDSHVRPLWVVTATCIGLVAGAAFETLAGAKDGPAGDHGPAKAGAPNAAAAPGSPPRGLCAVGWPLGWQAGHYVLKAASIVVLIITAVCTLGFSRPRSLIFRDRTNDVFFGQVAAGTGLLLTGGDLHLIQLKTRRPVLLDGGGLDGVLYSLEAGPTMQRILGDVYGIDLLQPPDEARGAGRIPPLANQKIWEAYSSEQWREIKQRFGVTQVLTYPDWTLNLPIAASSRRMLLYDIP